MQAHHDPIQDEARQGGSVRREDRRWLRPATETKNRSPAALQGGHEDGREVLQGQAAAGVPELRCDAVAALVMTPPMYLEPFKLAITAEIQAEIDKLEAASGAELDDPTV